MVETSTSVPLQLEVAPVSPKQAKGAIVIGGNYRGLGVIRSLGRHGIPVWVLTDEHQLAAYSRYATKSMPWPPDEQRQLELLAELCGRYGLAGWMLFPSGDEEAGMLARHHEQLSSQFQLTVPSWDVLRWAYDKRLTHQLAAQHGVPFPLTFYPRNRSECAALDCPFPAILKPAIKEGFNAFVHAKAWRVENQKELVVRYDQASALVSPDIIMVQELIPGGGEEQFSYAALVQDGHPIVSLVARRTRQYPPEFGRSSSFVETVDAPVVEQQSLPLLCSLAFTGLVEVEFKRDPRNGQYKVLDINPRVWGWHTLGRQYGADFPYLYWRLLHGEPIAETRVPAGVHWLRMSTDLLTAVDEIVHGQLSPIDYIRSLRQPLEFAVMARDDPRPGLMEMLLLSQVALKRRAL